jgi:hypothetical protein
MIKRVFPLAILSLSLITRAATQKPSVPTQNVSPRAQELCQRVKDIRLLPLKAGGREIDYSRVDPVYNELRKMDDEVVPCLIQKITDTAEMNDPRDSFTVGRVKVGDVAFWVLLDITGLPHDDMFPPDVRNRFAKEGMYAYFDWVNRTKHRRILQQNVLVWYSRNHPTSQHQ